MTVQAEQRGDLLYIPTHQVYPNDWNPNEMSARKLRFLKDRIQRLGFTDAITVVKLDDDHYRIIGGEHRWKACCELKRAMIPALVLDLDDYDELLQQGETVAHNILHGELNPEKFLKLHEAVADEIGRDKTAEHFGFDEEREMKRYLKMVEDQMKGTLPDGANAITDVTGTTATDLKAIIQEMMDMFGDTIHHSFMVFVYAKKPHVYVRLSEDGYAGMQRVLDYLRATGMDINKFLGPVLQAAVENLPSAPKAKADGPVEDDVDF